MSSRCSPDITSLAHSSRSSSIRSPASSRIRKQAWCPCSSETWTLAAGGEYRSALSSSTATACTTPSTARPSTTTAPISGCLIRSYPSIRPMAARTMSVSVVAGHRLDSLSPARTA
ncbi:hypothetical protein BC342_12410 [Streptomyces olivaceus]|nr:hypothetical protein BC342_12410 [Streptomyces olivaceus]